MKSNEHIVQENDLVPKSWTDDTQMTVEQWGERQYEFGYKRGIEDGFGQAFSFLIEKAASLFKLGEDERAMEIRKIANEIRHLQKQNQ